MMTNTEARYHGKAHTMTTKHDLSVGAGPPRPSSDKPIPPVPHPQGGGNNGVPHSLLWDNQNFIDSPVPHPQGGADTRMPHPFRGAIYGAPQLAVGLLLLILIAFAPIAIANDALEFKIDSMFVIASSGDFKYRDLVQPTIDDIAEIGGDAVPHLIAKLGTPDARERVTLENIFKKIGDPAVPLLQQAIPDADSLQLSRIALMLYFLPDTTSVAPLIPVVNDDYYWARYQAVRALGKIGDLRAVDNVKGALTDENELVRTMAAVSAERLGGEHFISELIYALDDDYYGVRMAAVDALAGIDCDQRPGYLLPYLNSATPDMQIMMLNAFTRDTCLVAYSALTPYLVTDNPYLISAVLPLAHRADPDKTAKFIEQLDVSNVPTILRQTIEELNHAAQTTPTNP